MPFVPGTQESSRWWNSVKPPVCRIKSCALEGGQNGIGSPFRVVFGAPPGHGILFLFTGVSTKLQHRLLSKNASGIEKCAIRLNRRFRMFAIPKTILRFLCFLLLSCPVLPRIRSLLTRQIPRYSHGNPYGRSLKLPASNAMTPAQTALNFDGLGYELAEADAFRMWEKVFDMVASGKMPPEKKLRRLDPRRKKVAHHSLGRHLREASLVKQKKNGRTGAATVAGRIRIHAPRPARHWWRPRLETAAGKPFLHLRHDRGKPRNFPVHIRSYLAAADAAIDEAIQLGKRPSMAPRVVDYKNHSYVKMWFERELRRGGNTVKRTEDAFVTFDAPPHNPDGQHGHPFSCSRPISY